ncbi:MAG: multiple sugar transport system permease protein [Clostridiales bacterium]|nr:multiple sugar transport system permease protein [Clostridiales bacterium]
MYFPNKRQKRIAVAGFLLPSMVGLLVFCLLPMIASAVYSLLSYDVLRPLSEATLVGLGNYKTLFSEGELFTTLWHNLQYLLMYIPVIMVTSLTMGILLNQDFRGRRLVQIIFYTPVITSWVAAAVVWRWILSGKFGFINQWLAVVGIDAPAWLSDPAWAMVGIVIVAVWKDTGYYALFFLAALKGIDPTYYEAAQMDGAKWYQKLFRITLPLISPTIFLLFVYNVIAGFQVFDSVQIMTGGGPAGATTVMMERVYKYGFKMYQMGYAAAWSWVLFAIIFVATILQFILQKRWVNYDA